MAVLASKSKVRGAASREPGARPAGVGGLKFCLRLIVAPARGLASGSNVRVAASGAASREPRAHPVGTGGKNFTLG